MKNWLTQLTNNQPLKRVGGLTFKSGIKMSIKKLYSQAIGQAQTELEDAEMIQNNQLRLKPEDYNNPDDFEQERQENSDTVYQYILYLDQLKKLAENMENFGVNVK